jgi:hypothetical protein
VTVETIFDTTIRLPAPPTGWFDFAYAVLWNADLALVRVDRDIHAEIKVWRDHEQPGTSNEAYPSLREARLRLTVFDGSRESGAIEVPAGDWPKVDRLPDGRWLVASSRAGMSEDNAHLYGRDGAPAGAFAVGDSIEHLRCAADGTIWVGYFDEGISLGQNEDGSWPISTSGIARFSPDGRVLWTFNDPGRTALFVSDCYALTLDGSTLWCCPYTDYPIVRIEDEAVKHWRNGITGAKALAVEGDHVLLAGGYRDRSKRLALLHLGDDEAHPVGEWQLPQFDRHAAGLLQGCGGTLHFVSQGSWSKLSLATLCRESRR